MDVVLSSNTSWYLYNFRKNTVLAFVASGYSVAVVAPRDEYSSKLEELGCHFYDIDIDPAGINPLRDIGSFLSFIKLYKKLRPRVVLNFTPKNNIYSGLVARFYGVPAINNIAGLGKVFVSGSILSVLVRFLYRVSQGRACRIFFQNEEDLSVFVGAGIVKKDQVERLNGSGVDLSRFDFEERKADGVIRFLMVARLLREKGVYEYVSAARALVDKYGTKVEFRLLGFIDESRSNSVSMVEVENWSSEGLIHYLGVSDSVEQEISKVDCIVLPSFYREGVPKSLLEGLASGKVIVTTDNVGCRETVVDGVNGFLCEPRSVDSLVRALDKYIQSPYEVKHQMGTQGRKLAESKFDEKIVISRYLDAVSSVLGK